MAAPVYRAFQFVHPDFAVSGEVPGLRFAPGEFAKIDVGCSGSEQCQLEIVGTLDLVVSPELPTSLKFSDVHVVSTAHG